MKTGIVILSVLSLVGCGSSGSRSDSRQSFPDLKNGFNEERVQLSWSTGPTQVYSVQNNEKQPITAEEIVGNKPGADATQIILLDPTLTTRTPNGDGTITTTTRTWYLSAGYANRTEDWVIYALASPLDGLPSGYHTYEGRVFIREMDTGRIYEGDLFLEANFILNNGTITSTRDNFNQSLLEGKVQISPNDLSFEGVGMQMRNFSGNTVPAELKGFIGGGDGGLAALGIFKDFNEGKLAGAFVTIRDDYQ